MPEYKSYEDFYDNGPGSEAFKRSVAQDTLRFHRSRKIVFINGHMAFVQKPMPRAEDEVDSYDYQI